MDRDKLFDKNIGELLRKSRKTKGLSQFEVAARTQGDDKHYGKLENGVKSPSLITSLKIAHVLDLDTNLFLQEFRKIFVNDEGEIE